MSTSNPIETQDNVVFIGGGNMASAILGGLLRQGLSPSKVQVVEPFEEQRIKLRQQFGVQVHAAPGPSLLDGHLIVWAVKPQTFKDAALQTQAYTQAALHLSVAACIPSSSIARWMGTDRVVRSMPNTPALIGKGVTALYAREAVTPADRQSVERVIQTTGDYLWLDKEPLLDAVTAISGSGPAYVFYFIEAMIEAGTAMGLTREQATKLAIGTFVGSSALAESSDEPPEVLRGRVTSKNGTTYAAMTSLEKNKVKNLFIEAMEAARHRAAELGHEFGAS